MTNILVAVKIGQKYRYKVHPTPRIYDAIVASNDKNYFLIYLTSSSIVLT